MSELVSAVLSFIEKEQRDKIGRIPLLEPEGRAQKEEVVKEQVCDEVARALIVAGGHR